MARLVIIPGRNKRSPWPRRFALILLFFLAWGAINLYGAIASWEKSLIPGKSMMEARRNSGSFIPASKAMAPPDPLDWPLKALRTGLPLLDFRFNQGKTPDLEVWRVLTHFAGWSDPRQMLGSQLVAIDNNAEEEEEIIFPEEANLPGAAKGIEQETLSGKPGNALVGIYNTHNSESYIPSQGKAKLEGKSGGVVKVAEELAGALEKEGITFTVALNKTIHDYPNYDRAYLNSEQTARSMLKNNPSLQVLIDVHRDAGVNERETVQVMGERNARLLFIVGRGARQPFPGWQKNRDFAESINTRLEKLAPGISKGVRVQDGRYNQHLGPLSLLAEIGATENSQEEASRAARLLAKALADIFKDIKDAKKI